MPLLSLVRQTFGKLGEFLLYHSRPNYLRSKPRNELKSVAQLIREHTTFSCLLLSSEETKLYAIVIKVFFTVKFAKTPRNPASMITLYF